jgi:hypothetical protein
MSAGQAELHHARRMEDAADALAYLAAAFATRPESYPVFAEWCSKDDEFGTGFALTPALQPGEIKEILAILAERL